MRDDVAMLRRPIGWPDTQNDPRKNAAKCIHSSEDLYQIGTPNQTKTYNMHYGQWNNVDIGPQHYRGIFPLERLTERLSQDPYKSIII